MKRLLFIAYFILCSLAVYAQSGKKVFSFAFLSDVHIAENAKSVDDALLCVQDINNNPEIEFSIIAGDITEFGSDKEIELAKQVFDNFTNPYYIVAGNHDSKWSESGCNTFVKVFGYEGFEFDMGGIKFIGCNSGPNMRMAPALVPRETIVWLDSLSKTIDPKQPVVFVNHYPMDTSVLNYTHVLDILKKMNTQLIMNGHWHQDRAMTYEGIPGVIGRSTQAKGKRGPGYTIVKVEGSTITFSERVAAREENGVITGGGFTSSPWHTLRMSNGAAYDNEIQYPRNCIDINGLSGVRRLWGIQDNTDIGAGAVLYKDYVVYANTAGIVKALNSVNGELIWSYKTDGKIFSTPAIESDIAVVGSTDGFIYAFNVKSGSLIWKYKCDKSVLGSPAIYGGNIYIGASDGIFRAINLRSGKLVWDYTGIKGFIEAKPFVDKDQVVIGDWANTLYSFDTRSGKLQWEWSNKGSRMLSPAAVFPVKANNKIFFVTPERVSYAVDAKTGKQLWRNRGGRESIGLSPDKKEYYVKIMKDSVASFSTVNGDLLWKTDCKFGYEIAPTPIASVSKGGLNNKGLLFVPTDKGNVIALNVADGSYAWIYKVSSALINFIQPINDNKLLVSTMDGIVTILQY